MKKEKSIIGAGLFTALASSLCCITPVLALVSGTSGIASTFSWLEPMRPYFIGITILVLGFAWYQKIKPKPEIDCECEEDEKEPFMQSKLFLAMITVFALVMTAFPYYSAIFYPDNQKEVVLTAESSIQTVYVAIEGMTCQSCEEHVSHEVNKLEGIVRANTSYEKGNAVVEFDASKTSIAEIEKAVNSTGYKVINKKQ
jgi:copper chaperone CopZ